MRIFLLAGLCTLYLIPLRSWALAPPLQMKEVLYTRAKCLGLSPRGHFAFFLEKDTLREGDEEITLTIRVVYARRDRNRHRSVLLYKGKASPEGKAKESIQAKVQAFNNLRKKLSLVACPTVYRTRTILGRKIKTERKGTTAYVLIQGNTTRYALKRGLSSEDSVGYLYHQKYAPYVYFAKTHDSQEQSTTSIHGKDLRSAFLKSRQELIPDLKTAIADTTAGAGREWAFQTLAQTAPKELSAQLMLKAYNNCALAAFCAQVKKKLMQQPKDKLQAALSGALAQKDLPRQRRFSLLSFKQSIAPQTRFPFALLYGMLQEKGLPSATRKQLYRQFALLGPKAQKAVPRLLKALGKDPWDSGLRKALKKNRPQKRPYP